jgi:hypothetical protein
MNLGQNANGMPGIYGAVEAPMAWEAMKFTYFWTALFYGEDLPGLWAGFARSRELDSRSAYIT